MAFCSHCGAQVDEGAAFCPSCGAPVGNGPRHAEPALDPNDVAQNRGISVLSYLGPLVFIPLFARKNSPYAQFHAKQGVTMFAFWVAAAILNSLLGLIRVTRVGILTVYTTIPWYISILRYGISAFVTVLAIIGIVNAAKGQAKELPIIGGIHIVK